MSNQTLSPIKRMRRDKIIEAAEQLFVADGYRATTMEGIARTVGMSKVTVYGYFKDKDLLFDAVAEAIAADMQNAFDAALLKGTTTARQITSALIAKHAVVRDRVRRSSFAPELFVIKNRASAARFKALDDGFIGQIAKSLRTVGYGEAEAKELAGTLFAASQGIANAAKDAEQMRHQIGLLALMISESSEED